VTTTWLTPREAAAYAKCDIVTLRRAVQRGALQAYRLNGGHRVRFRVVDVDAWMTAAPAQKAVQA
jgi:excisionase family DNA binding protein